MPYRDAAQRVRDRIRAWMAKEGRGSKTALAKAVPAPFGTSKSRSWVTSILKSPDNKGQDVRLKDLDAIAEVMGMQPGELVAGYDRAVLEVTMAELRLLQYFRYLPDSHRAYSMHLLDYLFRPHIDEGRTPTKLKRKRKPKPLKPAHRGAA